MAHVAKLVKRVDRHGPTVEVGGGLPAALLDAVTDAAVEHSGQGMRAGETRSSGEGDSEIPPF